MWYTNVLVTNGGDFRRQTVYNADLVLDVSGGVIKVVKDRHGYLMGAVNGND